MTGSTIGVEPLTPEAFAPFGAVIEAADDQASVAINNGETRKFADQSRVESPSAANIHVYRSHRACEFPLALHRLERHPLASQAFLPMSGEPFLVVVATAVARPEARHLRAFLSNGRQGINLRPNTWHHHLLTLVAGQCFSVIDGPCTGNLELVDLVPPTVVTWSGL